MVVFNECFKSQFPSEMSPIFDQFEKILMDLSEESKIEVIWSSTPSNIVECFNNHLDLLRAMYVAKISTLMLSLIETANRGDFFMYGLIGRSLIEHTAMLRYYQFNKIKPIIQRSISAGTVTQGDLNELIQTLERHLRSGCFDWESFLTGDFGSLESKSKNSKIQVRIGDCIKKWGEQEKNIPFLYSLFCDLVHPNIGSSLLVLRVNNGTVGFGGESSQYYGLKIFDITIIGLAAVIKDAVNLLNNLILLRIPEN